MKQVGGAVGRVLADSVGGSRAMWLGFLGILGFSSTLPATSLANPDFGPWTVALGRVVLAAALAATILLVRRQPLLPPRESFVRVAYVAVGAIIAFPILTSLALEYVSSAHGAVVTGLIPAATAGMAVVTVGERPRPAYWVALGIGLTAVVSLPVIQGAGALQVGDLLLLAAVVSVGFGYVHGGVLARKHGGWRVICWAVVLSLPVAVPITAVAGVTRGGFDIELDSVLAIVWLGLVSTCLAYFPWYAGLASGGLARVGRLQLIQPVLTIVWSILFLGERVGLLTVLAALVIVGSVSVGRKANAAPATPPSGVKETAVRRDEGSSRRGRNGIGGNDGDR